MRDSDDLNDIPPIVPSRDDVTTHQQSRLGQSREIVRPAYAVEKRKVSTWPVRIMLALLTLAFIGAAAGANYFYEQYQNAMQQADLRLSDLERRLALVGEESEDTVLNIQETLDFHFSEIDKLWAARNALRSEATDIRSELAKLALVNEGQDETVAALTTQLETARGRVGANETRVNTLSSELDGLSSQMADIDASMDALAALRNELQAVQNSLNSGDSTLLGVAGRVDYLEESMESVNAHRLQINETLFRLQERIDAMQRQQGSGNL
ncbi:MAG: hypothetical protein R3F41_03705 [Gammaproteobacteria bacterium]|nr:hypothetical protein [Pseudomonadales bacterium]MCP5345603.1 hypothetical protein [Pseudomonadales bacterium]